MSYTLELAEHYRAVADDLARGAREQLAVADALHKHADRLCEENMAAKAAADKIREHLAQSQAADLKERDGG